MLIQFVRRYDNAGSGFLNLTSLGGVQTHQEDVTASGLNISYHCHSSASNLVSKGGRRSSSSPRRCNSAAAWAQPFRGVESDEMMIDLPRTCRSTSSERFACAINGLGMRTPRELPI